MMKLFQKVAIVGFVMCLLCALFVPAKAQLSIQTEVDETLSNSQTVKVQSIISNNGRGPTLFRMFLRNNSSEYINDLYLRILIESKNVGRIIDLKQVGGQPFSLSPGQQVFATNNNIGEGLPGIEEAIQFNGDFTPEGQEFINKLQGSPTLPADIYQITTEVYQGSVGGELLARQTDEFGGNIVENTQDFYLLSPGDVVGSSSIISSIYPNFQWQGATSTRYRLIVVESRSGESPQSLMDGAQGTQPIQTNGPSASGSLVDYEMLDVEVNQSSFQYPNSGVQSLEPGKKYYWRIIAQLETSNGIEARESEIWNFTLLDPHNTGTAQGSGEAARILQQLLGNRLQQLNQGGYSFQSIVIDGQAYQGGQALQKLMELGRQIDQGDVSIVIEEQ